MVLQFVWRHEWGALEAASETPLATPVPNVIIKYHSKMNLCHESAECRDSLRTLQTYQMKILDYPDIEYNFYIGGDGKVYEGRGWNYVAKDDHELSGQSLDIAYIGDFPKGSPIPVQMEHAFNELTEYGVDNNFISKDYKLIEMRMESLKDLLKKSKHPKTYNKKKKK